MSCLKDWLGSEWGMFGIIGYIDRGHALAIYESEQHHTGGHQLQAQSIRLEVWQWCVWLQAVS